MRNIIIDADEHIVFNPTEIYIPCDGEETGTIIINVGHEGGVRIKYRSKKSARIAIGELLDDICEKSAEDNDVVYCVLNTIDRIGKIEIG